MLGAKTTLLSGTRGCQRTGKKKNRISYLRHLWPVTWLPRTDRSQNLPKIAKPDFCDGKPTSAGWKVGNPDRRGMQAMANQIFGMASWSEGGQTSFFGWQAKVRGGKPDFWGGKPDLWGGKLTSGMANEIFGVANQIYGVANQKSKLTNLDALGICV